MPERIGFIGAGKLATGLALALHSRGLQTTAVVSRTTGSARKLASLIPGMTPLRTPAEAVEACDIIFIATPDAAIKEVADSITWGTGQGVVHCSGALTLESLANVSSCGASIASLHPLQTLSCIETPQEAAERLSGICYALEAKGWLSDWLQNLVDALDGHIIQVAPENRALYHQAAVFACGYLSALLDAAEEIWTQMGFSPGQARTALTPLAQTTVSNFGRVGSHTSITGPIPRGDTETVKQQLAALEDTLPNLAPLARELGLRSLAFAPEQETQVLAGILAPHDLQHQTRTKVAPTPHPTTRPDPTTR